jgi:hypothetical protein
MALSPAEKQQRYRDRRKEKAQKTPEAEEVALMTEVERVKHGELSEQERTALADKLVNLAKRYLWHAHELSKIASKVRDSWRVPAPHDQLQRTTNPKNIRRPLQKIPRTEKNNP